MKKTLTKLCLLIWIALLYTTIIYASAETLPEHVWRISYRHDVYDVDRAVGQTFTNGIGNGDNQVYDITAYPAKCIESFQPLIAYNLMDANLPLAKSGGIKKTYLGISYGISDQFTVFFTLPYVQKSLKYSQAYIDTISSIKTNYPAFGSSLSIPPTEAKGEGIGDASIGCKYRMMPNWALALKYQGGPLRFGKDGTEIKPKRDHFEEIYTGDKADIYTIASYYDWTLGKLKCGLFMAYEISTDGYEKFFENDFEINNGDQLIAGIDLGLPITKEWLGTAGLIYQHAATDKRKISGSWQDITNTEVTALLLNLGMIYRPVIFLEFWTNCSFPLKNQAALGIYDFPGRLETNVLMQFGLNVYFK